MQNSLLVFLFLSISYSIRSENSTEFHVLRDNGTLCTYYFDFSNTQENFSILLFLQGSETTSAYGLKKIVDPAWLKKNNVALLIVEKPGISQSNFDEQEYLKLNTLFQRANDCQLVLKYIYKNYSTWNKELLLCGCSEGATLAVLLGSRISEVKGIVMLAGGGGMSLKEELLLLAKKGHIGYYYFNVITSLYIRLMRAISKFMPNSTYTCIGSTNTLKYWHSIADYNPLKVLENLSIPLYVAHGSCDKNAPIESAEILVNHFKNLKKSNLVFKKYDEFDHHFNDFEGKNHFIEVVNDALEWASSILY